MNEIRNTVIRNSSMIDFYLLKHNFHLRLDRTWINLIKFNLFCIRNLFKLTLNPKLMLFTFFFYYS